MFNLGFFVLLFSAVGSKAAKPATSVVPVEAVVKKNDSKGGARNKRKHVQRRLLNPQPQWKKKTNPYAKQYRFGRTRR